MSKATILMVVQLGALGYLVLYGFGLVMGAYSPGELIGFTLVGATALALLLVVGYRRHRALADESDAEHAELMREAHDMREKRGF